MENLSQEAENIATRAISASEKASLSSISVYHMVFHIYLQNLVSKLGYTASSDVKFNKITLTGLIEPCRMLFSFKKMSSTGQGKLRDENQDLGLQEGCSRKKS